MEKNRLKKVPFRIERADSRPLVKQVVDGLKSAINTRHYVEGDLIPPTRELAELLGVSRIVTRLAVRQLAEEGYLNPRIGRGCEVLGRRGKLWRGNILFVMRADKGSYYANTFANTLGDVLVKAGWRFNRVVASEADVSALELGVSHPIDLALVLFENDAAEKKLSKAGVPFLSLSSEPRKKRKSCVAQIHFSRGKAVAEMAADVRACGITRVWQVGFEPQPDDRAMLTAAGLACEERLVNPAPDLDFPEAVVHGAQCAFARMLARAGKKLPAFIYFSDDYVCQGALLALMRAGLEIPRDVRVATWSNCGNGPYYFTDFPRVQMSPREHAKALAEKVIDWLKEKTPIEGLEFSARYINRFMNKKG